MSFSPQHPWDPVFLNDGSQEAFPLAQGGGKAILHLREEAKFGVGAALPALCPYHTGWQDALAGVGRAPCSQAGEQGCQEGMRRDQGRWQGEGVGGLTAQGDGEAQEWCQPGARRCWGGADTWLPSPSPRDLLGPLMVSRPALPHGG